MPEESYKNRYDYLQRQLCHLANGFETADFNMNFGRQVFCFRATLALL